MAFDRLAASRATQGSPASNPRMQASGNQRYQNPRHNPYAQQDDQSYEMSKVEPPAPSDNMGAFYAEITSLQDSIKAFNGNVDRISGLHLQSLSNMADGAAQGNADTLDSLVRETSELSRTLKIRIKNLEAQRGATQERKQQTAFVKSKFVEAIQRYQGVEQQYRLKHKQRMERQIKIVKPHATRQEIDDIVNNPNDGQIFSQALTSGSTSYREVQNRHEDIKRIEQTLAELAQLFNDMSVLVDQQQEMVDVITTQAANVQQDTEAGLKHTDAAVKSAQAARKKRWICFFIVILIIVIIAAVIGGYYASQNRK